MLKKVFIRSFGCQMNNRDSEVVKGLLVAKGYRLVQDEKAADIILFNTCSVREHAEDKVWSAVGKYRGKRGEGRGKKKQIIGVIGCMAQNYKDEIFRRAPGVDIVCGPSCIDQLPSMIKAVSSCKTQGTSKDYKSIETKEKIRPEEIYHTGFYESKDHAYVVISEGCDNFCSYCVVPYARGRLRHRPAEEILKEVEAAVVSGIGNITLLGQNVNSYKSQDTSHKTQVNFLELLKEISMIEKLKSLSFVTSHPKDTEKELFEIIASMPVIKKSLHMPVQSGSDHILKAMNRGYTAGQYLKLVDQYRLLVYNGQISTDIIVGFPGETEGDFKKTMALVKRAEFNSAFIFKYSPRPNTKAALMKDDVSMETKKRRHSELLALQREISKNKRKGV